MCQAYIPVLLVQEEDLRLVREEDCLRGLEEDCLFIQEEDFLLAKEDLLLVQEEDLLLVNEEDRTKRRSSSCKRRRSSSCTRSRLSSCTFLLYKKKIFFCKGRTSEFLRHSFGSSMSGRCFQIHLVDLGALIVRESTSKIHSRVKKVMSIQASKSGMERRCVHEPEFANTLKVRQ